MPSDSSDGRGPQPGSSAPVPHDVYDELLALLGAAPDLDAFLQQLAELAVQAVAGVVAASVTISRDGRPQTVATTSALASAADEQQYDMDDGPCLQCLRTGEVVAVPDLEQSPWAALTRVDGQRHPASSLSLPLDAGGRTLGALNLYAEERYALTDGDRETTLAFAARAAGGLGLVVQRVEQARLTAQLQEALASRSVIDQALGIVMAREKVDSQAAFAQLRAVSSKSNRKLRDLAAALVEQASGHPLAEPPHFRSGPVAADTRSGPAVG